MMISSSSSSEGKFKYPVLIQILAAVAVAVLSSYLTIVQASIPRKDAEEMIHQSEARAMYQIDKLDNKQDIIIEKLEKLQMDMAAIKGKVK